MRTSPRELRGETDVVEADIPELLVTGCRDTQTSADAYIGNSYNGALTYYLVEALAEGEGKISYRDLHANTVAKLQQGDYDQVPQLEGRKEQFDRQFLSPLV